VLVCAVIATLVVAPAAARSEPAPPVLSAKPVETLVTDVLLGQRRSVSGTIRASADLGLPDLPAADLGGIGVVTSLLSGTHTLRYWQLRSTSQRLAVLQTLAETDVIRDDTGIAAYDSRTDTATRLSFAPRPAQQVAAQPIPAFLTDLIAPGPYTSVRTGPNVWVAGRAARTLILTPRQQDTLVDHVVLAVDAQYATILRLQVFSRGHTAPAFAATYTDVDYAEPAAKLFDLPAIKALPRPAVAVHAAPASSQQQVAATTPGIERVGAGWSSILVIRGLGLTRPLTGQLDSLGTKVTGGHLLQTRLLTALLTDDGTLYLGAVPASALLTAAQAQAAAP